MAKSTSKRPTFRERLEQHAIWSALCFLLVGFAAGIGAYRGILEITKQETVLKGTLVDRDTVVREYVSKADVSRDYLLKVDVSRDYLLKTDVSKDYLLKAECQETESDQDPVLTRSLLTSIARSDPDYCHFEFMQPSARAEIIAYLYTGRLQFRLIAINAYAHCAQTSDDAFDLGRTIKRNESEPMADAYADSLCKTIKKSSDIPKQQETKAKLVKYLGELNLSDRALRRLEVVCSI